MADVGELGISTNEVGTVAQALGAQAIDRGNATKEQVVAYLTSDDYDEDELWTALGPLIDKIEDDALAMPTPEQQMQQERDDLYEDQIRRFGR